MIKELENSTQVTYNCNALEDKDGEERAKVHIFWFTNDNKNQMLFYNSQMSKKRRKFYSSIS